MLGARKVVVTQRFFDDRAHAYLRSHGCEVTIAPCRPERPTATCRMTRWSRSWPARRAGSSAMRG
jgi:hypothetical protein